ERLAKLILVADYAIAHEGQMPSEKIIRQFGHKLVDLTNAADAISQKHAPNLNYPRPKSSISTKDAFAETQTSLHWVIPTSLRKSQSANGGTKSQN
ncbi:MAG TPA: hypothetical protein VIF39_00290, partial [Hyphomicrobium sp.]